MKFISTTIRNFFNISTEPPEIWSLKRVRDVIRGYRILKASENSSLINAVVEQITEAEISSKKVLFSDYIFPFNPKIRDRSYSQYLLLNLIGTRLHASILAHLANGKPIVFPLPVEWINVLKKNNIKVSRGKSGFIFYLFAVKRFLLAIAQFFKLVYSNFIYQFAEKEQRKDAYIYFMGLHPDCLPPADGSFRYNIIEWYLNLPEREKEIKEIWHNVNRNEYLHKDILIKPSSYMPKIDSTFNFFVFVLWGFFSLLLSFFYLVTGRVRYAIILSEIQKAKVFSLSDRSSVAREYLFNNLNIIYRPLWTYVAESHGVKIIFYNWAASFADFLGPKGYKPTDLGEKLLNYPNILQWSSQYADYLRSIFPPEWTEVKVVSPIYFCDAGAMPVKLDKPVIVVFDVTPQKNFFHDLCAPFVEYRTFKISKQFLEDVYQVARENGYDIIWKAKRSFISNHSKSYINYSNKFTKMPGIIAADPRISAFRLVQEADAVISIPFTSTALIAESFNIPSVYYDPSKILFKEDRAAQGIPLVSGKEELKNWFQSFKTKVL